MAPWAIKVYGRPGREGRVCRVQLTSGIVYDNQLMFVLLNGIMNSALSSFYPPRPRTRIPLWHS